MTTYQCLSHPEEGLTFAPIESIEKLRRDDLLAEDSKLEYQFEAATWEEAMTEHHIRQGWEPYRPCRSE